MLISNSVCSANGPNRFSDLRVEILEPTANSTFYSPASIGIQIVVYNQGPDIIKPTDTLRYDLYTQFSQRKPMKKVAIGREVLPGDSFLISEMIYIDTAKSFDNLRITFRNAVIAYGPKGTNYGPLFQETSETWSDNKPGVSINYIWKGVSVNNPIHNGENPLFPNPTSNSMVYSETALNRDNIEIFDLSGRKVEFSFSHDGNKTVIRVFSRLGQYVIVHIRYGGVIERHKIMIQ